MKNSAFYQMFLTLLNEIYDTEQQLVKALPVMSQSSSHKELKEGINEHLKETKEQVKRLNEVFKVLNEKPTHKECKTIQGLLLDAGEVLKKNVNANVKDAFIIICAQKVEHYEMACYGSAISLAKHFEDAYEDVDFDKIVDLLKDSLDEEFKADKKLTTLAEGSFFSSGINDEAEKELQAHKK